MNTRTATVFLVVLVGLAGCAGSASDAARTTNTATTTNTVAAAEATTVETVSPATADLPPGVTESGVENVSRLLVANRRALSETGYAFRLVRGDTGQDRLYDSRIVSRGTVAKEFAPYRIRSVETLQFDNRSIRVQTDTWGNESVVLMRYDESNQAVYRKFVATRNDTVETNPFEQLPSFAYSAQLSHRYVVTFALITGEFKITSVKRRGDLTLTTLHATEINRRPDERGSENVSNYSATLVVDERGRIRRSNLSAEFEGSTFSYDFRLTDIGGVAVSRPGWADRALGTVTARIEVTADTANDSFVVSNEAGQVLPAGSVVQVSHAGVNATLELTDSVRPGEEVYVYVSDDGTPTLADGPPESSAADPLDGEYELVVVDPAGNVLVNEGFGFGNATASGETTEGATPETTTASNATE